MSKKCLVSQTGLINEVVEEGDEFEIYEGENPAQVWMDIPDSIDIKLSSDPTGETQRQNWRVVNGEFINTRPIMETKEFLKLQRMHAYGSIGEQLDMQYKDKLNGTTTWDDHIAEVKKLKKPSEGAEDYKVPADREEPQWKKID